MDHAIRPRREVRAASGDGICGLLPEHSGESEHAKADAGAAEKITAGERMHGWRDQSTKTNSLASMSACASCCQGVSEVTGGPANSLCASHDCATESPPAP